MVRITLGKAHDGALANVPATAVGEMHCGPLRLLSWLESQLGLTLPEVSFTSRMVQYLDCLKREARNHEDGGRFYEKSLAQDEFATARTLLQWRDTWFEAGWTGNNFSGDAPGRLKDIAAVEVTAGEQIALNTGQRVQRVTAALADTPLDVELTLLDAPENFPQAWRDLFSALNAEATPLAPSPSADPATDLGKLQRALVGEHAPGEKVQLSGDSSFLVLRDGSAQLSAPWIARFAHGQNAAEGSVAMLASANAATLAAALADAGPPRLGHSNTSFWRPVFQVLPLALELIWQPLDPAVLLQFLTHPMGPIKASIRRSLAAVVADKPGIGSEDWFGALDKALDAAVADNGSADENSAAVGDDGAATQGLSAEQQLQRTELQAKVDSWLNCERFDPQAGVPIEKLIERTRRVSEWLASALATRQDNPEAALYAGALSQADELTRTLERLQSSGTATLPRTSLRRLIEAVRGLGAPLPGRTRECAAGEPQLLRADTPASFIAPVPTVIWWSCDDETLPRQYPWSRAERAALSANGVELVPLETQLAWQAASWLHPILAATNRLVLVLHDNADGHHPVFDQIVAVAEGWAETRVDALMREPEQIDALASLPATRVIEPNALPAVSRWWQLPEGTALPPRKQDSYSSMERFLFAPHQWVLNYQARIRPGTLEAIADGNRLLGNLTHALFERYFEQHTDIPSLNQADAEDWARVEAESLIRQQGAVLLAAGRRAEKERFVAMAATALAELVRHLKQAEVTTVRMEMAFSGKFTGGRLHGYVDLIATKASGETAVVDIKWSGFNYRVAELVESNYLQLACYAELLFENENTFPALGYFIIDGARLAMLGSDFFPEATVEQPANGENPREFWQRVQATWRWRRELLDAGRIEVPVTDTEPDESSSPGDDGLPMPETHDRFDDYTALTGRVK